jgi:hypothetical protein
MLVELLIRAGDGLPGRSQRTSHGLVDPQPPVFACRELLVLLVYPFRHISPMNPLTGFFRDRPYIDVRARVLFILQELSD